MGELLPFQPRRSTVYNAAGPEAFEAKPFVWGQAESPATVALELGPGGSLAGATQPEVVAAAVEANPMRRLNTWECPACAHTWKAPAAARCPKCHSKSPALLEEDVCIAQRLK